MNVKQLRKVEDEIWRKYVDQSLVRRSEARFKLTEMPGMFGE